MKHFKFTGILFTLVFIICSSLGFSGDKYDSDYKFVPGEFMNTTHLNSNFEDIDDRIEVLGYDPLTGFIAPDGTQTINRVPYFSDTGTPVKQKSSNLEIDPDNDRYIFQGTGQEVFLKDNKINLGGVDTGGSEIYSASGVINAQYRAIGGALFDILKLGMYLDGGYLYLRATSAYLPYEFIELKGATGIGHFSHGVKIGVTSSPGGDVSYLFPATRGDAGNLLTLGLSGVVDWGADLTVADLTATTGMITGDLLVGGTTETTNLIATNLTATTGTITGELTVEGSTLSGGTADATSNIIIDDSTYSTLSILNSSAGTGYILFGDTLDPDVGQIKYTHATDTMNFIAGGSNAASFTSSAATLAGTLTTAGKLTVSSGGADITGAITGVTTLATSGAITSGGKLTVSSGGADITGTSYINNIYQTISTQVGVIGDTYFYGENKMALAHLLDQDIGTYINYDGYNGGTTRTRDLNVCDGQNGVIALFDATGKATNLYGTLTTANKLTVSSGGADITGAITGVTTLATSGAITSGGNLGVGTTTINNPAGYARVINLVGSDGGSIIINDTADTAKALQLNFEGGGNVGYVGTRGVGTTLAITTAGFNAITIDASQNISLAGTLTTGGDILAGTNNIRTNYLSLTSNEINDFASVSDAGGIWLNYTGYNATDTYYRDTFIGDGKRNKIVTVDGSAHTVSILGTTLSGATPDAVSNIVIDDATYPALSLLSGASSSGFILFGDSTDADVSQIVYNHATNNMTFVTNTTLGMTLTNGNQLKIEGGLTIADPSIPASSSASGTKGDIAYDDDYIYICISTDTWKRSPLTTW